jgi:hypothetical protein
MVVCTGSSAIDLQKGAAERLPGRRGAGRDHLVLLQREEGVPRRPTPTHDRARAHTRAHGRYSRAHRERGWPSALPQLRAARALIESFVSPDRLHAWRTARAGEVDFVAGPRPQLDVVEVKVPAQDRPAQHCGRGKGPSWTSCCDRNPERPAVRGRLYPRPSSPAAVDTRPLQGVTLHQSQARRLLDRAKQARRSTSAGLADGRTVGFIV